jgi:hypothetical protein
LVVFGWCWVVELVLGLVLGLVLLVCVCVCGGGGRCWSNVLYALFHTDNHPPTHARTHRIHVSGDIEPQLSVQRPRQRVR